MLFSLKDVTFLLVKFPCRQCPFKTAQRNTHPLPLFYTAKYLYKRQPVSLICKKRKKCKLLSQKIRGKIYITNGVHNKVKFRTSMCMTTCMPPVRVLLHYLNLCSSMYHLNEHEHCSVRR